MIAPYAWAHTRSYGRLIRDYARDSQKRDEIDAKYEWLRKELPAIDFITATSRIKQYIAYEVGRERGAEEAQSLQYIAEARMIVSLFALFESGMQVFEFTPELMRELAQTDVDEVLSSDIQLPYESFYIRLPGVFKADDQTAIDGIIIRRKDYQDAGITLVIEPTPVLEDPSAYPETLQHMPLGMMVINEDMTVTQAFNKAHDKMRDGLLHQNIGLLSQSDDDTVNITSQLDRALERYEAGRIFMNENMTAIINALLYVDQYHGREQMVWSPDAPAELLTKANSASTGARKAERKLSSLGWTKVLLCDLEAPAQSGVTHEGRQVRSHWRRGHWRRQRHGHGNSLSKLIRIRPIMVGHGQIADGRTYAVT